VFPRHDLFNLVKRLDLEPLLATEPLGGVRYELAFLPDLPPIAYGASQIPYETVSVASNIVTSAAGFVRTAFAAALGPAASPPTTRIRRFFMIDRAGSVILGTSGL